MLMSLCTWPEIDRYLEKSKGIIVPIGSTEQHGPTGLIGTDAICAEAIARGVGERVAALVAPTFNVGRAEHHMAFSGTITLRRTTMVAALEDWVASLARHGFERLFFINGHGGNIPVLKEVFDRIHDRPVTARGAAEHPLRCGAHNWWAGPEVSKLCKALYGASEGSHATPSEVAMAQHVHPEAIKQAELLPRIAPTGPIRGAADYRRRFPDGRIGSDPSLATPEAGGRILEAAIREIAVIYRDFVDDGR